MGLLSSLRLIFIAFLLAAGSAAAARRREGLELHDTGFLEKDARDAVPGYWCLDGQGASGKSIVETPATTKVECSSLCDQNPQCAGFDLASRSRSDSCRLFAENEPRIARSGMDNRIYCAKQTAVSSDASINEFNLADAFCASMNEKVKDWPATSGIKGGGSVTLSCVPLPKGDRDIWGPDGYGYRFHATVTWTVNNQSMTMDFTTHKRSKVWVTKELLKPKTNPEHEKKLERISQIKETIRMLHGLDASGHNSTIKALREEQRALETALSVAPAPEVTRIPPDNYAMFYIGGSYVGKRTILGTLFDTDAKYAMIGFDHDSIVVLTGTNQWLAQKRRKMVFSSPWL